jgi:hypothetical protein
MLRFFVVLLLVLAVSACVAVNKSILTPNPTGAVFAKEAVYVYFSTDSIPSHTRIAIMNAKGSDEWTKEGQMIDKIREEAGKLGANAVVLQKMEDPSTGRKVVSALFGTGADRKGQAIAIYVPSLDKRQR